MDAPFPLWMVFPVIFAALYLSHFSLLRLPYYWDEAGYYIPAAWDFFRTGSLIPITTMSNAHPPLPSVYLAIWWKLSGFYPEVTREAVLMVASIGLLAVWRLAQRIAGSGPVAFWTVVLTALYPVWFAQSTLAHADIFAAAFTLWGLVYALPDQDRRPVVAALWFTAAVLSKETAIVVPMTLAVIAAVDGFRSAQPLRKRRWSEAGWLASCALPLIAWYGWHFIKTGFVFGNPAFLKYNAQANFEPTRFLAAFGHRLLHLTAHMNMFVPMLLTIAALMLKPRLDRGRAGAASHKLCDPLADFLYSARERCTVQRVGWRVAYTLPAADVSAGASGCGVNVFAPGTVLADACITLSCGVSRRALYQSALPFCA